MALQVVVAGELEILVDDLSREVLDLIKSALTFANEEREDQQRMEIGAWWTLPETIDLWKIEDRRSGDRVLVMPRGFARALGDNLAEMGIEIEWVDRRTAPRAEPGYFRPFPFVGKYDYQFDAVLDLLRSEQGALKCPPGGGKTVMLLGTMAYAGLRSLVVVDKADLAEQWRERAYEFLGLGFDQVGKIGMNEWTEHDLTIALRQSLWSKIDELDATRWWEQWGLTVYDEHHHLAADTLAEVCRRVCSKIELGGSATPARSEIKGQIVSALIGPIVHETSRATLRARGILVMPRVEIVRTGFDAPFWRDHTVKAGDECVVPTCKKVGQQHKHRNNFSSIVKKLTEDDERNALIARKICSEPDHVHLVPSRQLKHLDAVEKALIAAGWSGPIYKLRGEENARGEAREIVNAIMEGGRWEFDPEARDDSRQGFWVQIEPPTEDGPKGSVVLSTVADEALDVPPIDRVHIIFPMRMAGAVEQLVGRVERIWPGKDDAVAYDYADATDVLVDQAFARLVVYQSQGYAVSGSIKDPEQVAA